MTELLQKNTVCFAGGELAKTGISSSRRQIDALQPGVREEPASIETQPALYNDSGMEDTAVSSIPMSTGPGYTTGLTDFQPPSDPGGRRQSNLSMEAGMQTRSDSITGMGQERGRNTQRGGQRPRGGPQDSGFTNIPSNIMNDRFDHYNRPSSRATSRDRSIDRFASRGTTPVPQEFGNSRSRAPSAQRHTAPDCTPDSGVFEDEAVASTVIPGGSKRPSRPTSVLPGEAPPLTGNGSVGGSFNAPYHIPSNQKEAESLLRQRACGQLIPQPPPNLGGGTVKRTESLYINPVIRQQQQQQQQPKVRLLIPYLIVVTIDRNTLFYRSAIDVKVNQ